MKNILPLAALLLSPAAWAGGHDIVSNDGSIPVPFITTGNLIDRGFVGGASRKISPLISPAEISQISQLPGLSGRPEPEVVFGIDTRFRVEPSTYPTRAVALITVGTARCTGWLAGPDTIITAGHCVHTGNAAAGGIWRTLESYTIYPGHTGTQAPYGNCKARRLYSTSGWADQGDSNYDYGAIKLDCQIGNSTGWLGYAAFSTITNYPSITNGYPGDKPLAQWASADVVRKATNTWLYYKNDTYAGMSGGPIWFDGDKGALAIGIHTYKDVKYNKGARINSSVFNNIRTWKNAD